MHNRAGHKKKAFVSGLQHNFLCYISFSSNHNHYASRIVFRVVSALYTFFLTNEESVVSVGAVLSTSIVRVFGALESNF